MSFNTASGMDCMQSTRRNLSERACMFQYRKRYGLHAILIYWCMAAAAMSFNTASGMDCMQSATGGGPTTGSSSFNTASGMDCMQYCLPEALETVSPKTEFLTMTPFSRFFPK